MLILEIKLNAENMLEKEPDYHVIEGLVIGLLPFGMESGKHSIALKIPLPDGKIVLAETSFILLVQATRAFISKYGDPLLIEEEKYVN